MVISYPLTRKSIASFVRRSAARNGTYRTDFSLHVPGFQLLSGHSLPDLTASWLLSVCLSAFVDSGANINYSGASELRQPLLSSVNHSWAAVTYPDPFYCLRGAPPGLHNWTADVIYPKEIRLAPPSRRYLNAHLRPANR